MPHDLPLMTTIGVALCVALLGGLAVDDHLGLIGEPEHMAAAERLFEAGANDGPVVLPPKGAGPPP